MNDKHSKWHEILACSLTPLPDFKGLPRFNNCTGVQCKIFLFGQPKKNQETCFSQTVGKQITQGLNTPQKFVVKYANNLVIPRDRRHVPFMIHRSILFYLAMLRKYCPTFFHLSWINQQNMSFNVLKFCAMEMFGKKIETNEQKESTKGDVMQKILEDKCVQNPIFQEKLRSAKQYTIFVEPSFNNEWGSRLDRNGA